MVEGVAADMGDPAVQHKALHITAVVIPGDIFGYIVIHATGAGDGQDTIFQRPVQIITAYAAVYGVLRPCSGGQQGQQHQQGQQQTGDLFSHILFLLSGSNLCKYYTTVGAGKQYAVCIKYGVFVFPVYNRRENVYNRGKFTFYSFDRGYYGT